MSTPAMAPLIVLLLLVTATPSISASRIERRLQAGVRPAYERREAAVAAALRDRDRVRRSRRTRGNGQARFRRSADHGRENFRAGGGVVDRGGNLRQRVVFGADDDVEDLQAGRDPQRARADHGRCRRHARPRLQLVRRRELLDLDFIAAGHCARRGRSAQEVGSRQRDLAALELVDVLELGDGVAKACERRTQRAERRELGLDLRFFGVQPQASSARPRLATSCCTTPATSRRPEPPGADDATHDSSVGGAR